MKLLVITRKIDRDDWLAGHGYEWVKKISAQSQIEESGLSVLCLTKGNTEGLRARVVALDEFSVTGRLHRKILRLYRFIRLAPALVRSADAVFCHQNPEYAIAVWPFVFWYRKRLVSWYTHKSVTWKTRLMLLFSDAVLTASPESFRLRSKKVSIIGHGIDTEIFSPADSPRDASVVDRLVSVGRISPVKRLEVLIAASHLLVSEYGMRGLRVEIVGDAPLPEHRQYAKLLKEQVRRFGLDDNVVFLSGIPHHAVVSVYQRADIFVNLSATGSLDKAVLEAMSCGCPVLTSNEAFRRVLGRLSGQLMCDPEDARDLAAKAAALLGQSEGSRRDLGAALRQIVIDQHDLDRLARRIVQECWK